VTNRKSANIGYVRLSIFYWLHFITGHFSRRKLL